MFGRRHHRRSITSIKQWKADEDVSQQTTFQTGITHQVVVVAMAADIHDNVSEFPP